MSFRIAFPYTYILLGAQKFSAGLGKHGSFNIGDQSGRKSKL
jgi:hypothetical protein